MGPGNQAGTKFQEFVGKGYVNEFDSDAELLKFSCGDLPVFAKVHVFTKTKNGRNKHRLVWGCKKAGPTRVLIWLALGLPLALKKAEFERRVS